MTIDLAARLLLDTRQVSENEELRSLVERMARAARRLDEMIQNISDSILVESGRVRMDLRPTDPSEVVEAAVESAGLPKGRPVRLRLEDGLPRIDTDPDHVERILHQLLLNALDFGREGTEIEIWVGIEDEEIVFSVTNEGEGISAEDLPRIFDRFFRRRPRNATKQEGLGLGLFVAGGLASACGGRLLARSEPGKRTTLSLALPISMTSRPGD